VALTKNGKHSVAASVYTQQVTIEGRFWHFASYWVAFEQMWQSYREG